VILYFISSSTAFSFAAKPQPPKPQAPKPKPQPPKPQPPKPQPPKPKPSTQKPIKPSTKKPNTKQAPKPNTKKPNTASSIQTPDKKGNCQSGTINISGDACVPGYKPKNGKCNKGDSLYNGNCFKNANDLSQYAKVLHQYIGGMPGDGFPVMVRNPKKHVKAGIKDVANLNGKTVNTVTTGDGNVMFVDGNQLGVGTVSGEQLVPLAGDKRRGIGSVLTNFVKAALVGAAAVGGAVLAPEATAVVGLAAAFKVVRDLVNKDPNIKDPSTVANTIIKTQIGPVVKELTDQGIVTKMPASDLTAFKLKPSQIYYSNQKQYMIDKDGKVQSVACKTKCKDNVNLEQATALQSMAIDAMKPGTVYQSGKNYYQVTQDGKGFQQCTPKSNRSLEYRAGEGSSTFCTSRAQPANSLIQQAINAANQGLNINPPQRTIVPYNNMSPINRDAATASIQNVNTSYTGYLRNVGNNEALSENEFYNRRADYMLANHTRVDNISNVLNSNAISRILEQHGQMGLINLSTNQYEDLTYLSTLYYNNGIQEPFSPAQAQNIVNISRRLNNILSYESHLNMQPNQWFNSVTQQMTSTLQPIPILPTETVLDYNRRIRSQTAHILSIYLSEQPQVSQNLVNYLDSIANEPPPPPAFPPAAGGGA